MINVNSLKPGLTFTEKEEIFLVVSTQHSKQGRAQANIKVKARDLRTGAITTKSYTSNDKVELAHIEKTKMDYLYKDSSHIFLMNNSTFEQIQIPLTQIKKELPFLKEGSSVTVKTYKKEILDLELAASVELEVIEATDAIKGNTQSNPQKKVKLETNLEIEVPMFIKIGDKIIVSTENSKYISKGGKQ